MQREPIAAGLLAVLALLALGVAAATLTDPVVVSGEGFGLGGESSAGVTNHPDDESTGVFTFEFPTNPDGSLTGACLAWLATPTGMLAMALLVLLPAAYVSYRTRWVVPGVAVVGAFGGPVYLVWLALTACHTDAFSFGFDGGAAGTGLGGLFGGGGQTQVADAAASQPAVWFGLLLLVAILGAGALLFVSTGSVVDRFDDPEPPEPESSPDPDVAVLGRVAGEAATRIAAAGDVDNEVYRAWQAMTDHLAVDHPASSTPAEFADAAVAAGMDAADVTELTGLFERVRYGGQDATPDDERRAVSALRRIEAAYSGQSAPR